MKNAIPNLIVGLLAVAALAATGLIVLRVLTQEGHGGDPAVSIDDGPLPELFVVPVFVLTDQQDQPFGSAELMGKVWVADFIFTRCGGVCPALSRQMAELQNDLADHPLRSEFRLVSISIDADYDTPEVLRDYGERFNLDPGQWSALNGPRERVWPLIESAFRLTVKENLGDDAMPFDHSPKFVLVDRSGVIRGYYDSRTGSEMSALRQDMKRLLDGG